MRRAGIFDLAGIAGGAAMATEAVNAVISGAFTMGVVDKIVAYCLPENSGSRGVLMHAGLLELRRIRRGAVVRGRPVDIMLYELDQIAWRRRSRKNAASVMLYK